MTTRETTDHPSARPSPGMAGEAIRIRPAAMSDYPALCRLFAELDALHRTARPGLFRDIADPARSEAFVRGLIEGADRALLVACGRCGPVGLAVLLDRQIPGGLALPPRRIVEIDNLVVTAACRGQGIGRALLRAAQAWARARRIARIELSVHEFNADAVAFYQRAGLATATRRMTMAA